MRFTEWGARSGDSAVSLGKVVVILLAAIAAWGWMRPHKTEYRIEAVSNIPEDVTTAYYGQAISDRYFVVGYTGRYSGDPMWIKLAVNEVVWWSRALNVEVDLEVLLTIAHVESRYNPTVTGKAGEIGMFQVNPNTFSAAELVLKRAGFVPGSLRDPKWQVAYGVAAYKIKKEGCKGDVQCAIKRYNGSGAMARKYLKRVNREGTKFFRGNNAKTP